MWCKLIRVDSKWRATGVVVLLATPALIPDVLITPTSKFPFVLTPACGEELSQGEPRRNMWLNRAAAFSAHAHTREAIAYTRLTLRKQIKERSSYEPIKSSI